MPWYRTEGKILEPLTDKDFVEGMEHGCFLHPKHKALNVLYYYSAVRKLEGLRATREQFQITRASLVFEVGQRLKHSAKTPALPLPLEAPYMTLLLKEVEATPQGKKVFPFSPSTAYRAVHRAFKYPHLFRLSRITNFFLEGWTIPQVRSWTGLSLRALDYYIGIVNIEKMAKSLR